MPNNINKAAERVFARANDPTYSTNPARALAANAVKLLLELDNRYDPRIQNAIDTIDALSRTIDEAYMTVSETACDLDSDFLKGREPKLDIKLSQFATGQKALERILHTQKSSKLAAEIQNLSEGSHLPSEVYDLFGVTEASK